MTSNLVRGKTLPMLQSLSSATSSCSSCSSNSGTDNPERLQKFGILARELADVVRQSQPGLDAVSRTLPSDHGKCLHPKMRSNSPTSTSDMLTGESSTYELSALAPLPIVAQTTHYFVSGKHLWIGVKEAAVLVLDDPDHELFVRLRNGLPPLTAAETLAEQNSCTTSEAWESVAKLLARMTTAGFLTGIEGYTERREPGPDRFARFHLTRACQLQCIHCYADSSPYVDRSGELSTERWGQILQDFAAIGGERVLFTGGEALIHKGCTDLMRRSKKFGLHVTLFTNGILVPKYAQAIRETVDQVQVSLDGPDEGTNDLIRGRGVYRKILRALDVLLEQGTPVRVGMTVMEHNWEAWKAGFLEFARRYAHSDIEFRLGFGLTHYGRATQLDNSPDINETQPAVQRFLAEVNGPAGPLITRRTTGCGYCEQLVVGPDGTVYPCHLLDGPVTHVDANRLPEIIALLKNMARLFDVDHTEGCNRCDIRYLCGGTCRVMNGSGTGSRLITTCTQADKQRRYRNLVEAYAQH